MAVVLLLALCPDAHAHERQIPDSLPLVKAGNISSRHSVHLELLGRTFIFGSLNYEYALTNHIAFGSGIGFIFIQKGVVYRDNNGVTEKGKYLDMSTSQMIYGNYFIGKDKHKLYFTAGLSHFLFSSWVKYPTGQPVSIDAQLEWNAGLGYQLSLNRMYYRLSTYCIRLPDPQYRFPKYLPWIGLSIGLKLAGHTAGRTRSTN